MKKLFKQSLYLFAGLVFFASCSDDAETPAPTVKIMNPPAATVDANGELTYTVEIKADEKIEKIVVTKKVGTSTNSVLTKTADFYTNTTDVLVYSYTVTETSGDIEFTFTVTDKAGKIAAETHKVTVTPVATAMTEFKNAQIINNKSGTANGSYNLITGETVSSTSTTRHIEDAGIDAALTAASNWKKQWNAVSGTEFVMVSGDALTYANATKEAVSAEFTSGTKVATTPVLAVGTLIIAKTETDHFLIEITAVTNTTADNNDKVEFKYKK